MLTLRILDLYCKAGGAAEGYARACRILGIPFVIVGVDNEPQPRYPHKHILADATTFDTSGYDFIHASPPCQEFSASRFLRDAVHPNATKHAMLVDYTYDQLRATGVPWIIENVAGAPLPDSVVLCGSMFHLNLRRHRCFASSHLLFAPRACRHTPAFVNVIGGKTRGYGDNRTHHLYHSADGRERRREACLPKHVGEAAMGIDWMTLDEMSEAVPPAYTEWLGLQLFPLILQQKEAQQLCAT